MLSGGESVILHRRVTTLDKYNRPTYSTENIELRNAIVAPGTSQEIVNTSGTLVRTRMTVHVKGAVEVTSNDQMTVRGVKYQVDGDTSGYWRNGLTGTNHGTLIELKKVSGG